MRDTACKAAFAVWLGALGLCLVAGALDWDIILTAFPMMMAAAVVLIALCYEVRDLLLKIVPAIAALGAVGWFLVAMGVPSWLWIALIPTVVILGLPRFERSLTPRA